MRIIISLLATLVLSVSAFAENITVLSFNMGSRNRTATQVADMIAAAHADVAFLQEIWVKAPQNTALHTMVAQLGTDDWDFATSSAYSLTTVQTVGEETYKTGGNGQNNAILYNKKKLALIDLADDLGFTHFDGDYRFDKNAVQAVRLALQADAEHECIAINVHLPYTDKAHRTRDVRTLERLYAHFKLRYGVLIAGDFNYHRKDLTTRNFDYVDGTEKWYVDRNFGIPTTLSTKGDTLILFANDYDHFVYSPKITVIEQMHRAFSDTKEKSCESLPFGTAVYTNSNTYRKEVSDHVPIIMVIDL